MTNQWAIATPGFLAIFVWPRISLIRLPRRAPGLSVRFSAGWPKRIVLKICRAPRMKKIQAGMESSAPMIPRGTVTFHGMSVLVACPAASRYIEYSFISQSRMSWIPIIPLLYAYVSSLTAGIYTFSASPQGRNKQ